MLKRLVIGMVLALALTGTAPAALAGDLTPSDIAGPIEWSAAADAVDENVEAAKAAAEAAKFAATSSKAAQAAAEDAAKKLGALEASINTGLSSLKANMAALSNLLSRIIKVLGA